ncbi:hypothetical protein [Nocardiopsis metallicus]|uniref:2'-5' RNA ligase n=1 Tax=Nocardiopsis metallicus TaxID=179819 RepID=A0A840WS56_9ACTN|nr:hypothetical protein [Nocardiopsis metallicus]MBB5494755.1 hypothetical protein [Nocardiopsis metallicus]
MHPFIGHGTAQWPPNSHVPHLYLIPDRQDQRNQGFFDLARRHRTILTTKFTHLLTPVQEPWLHATVQMVTNPHAPPLNKPVMGELIDRLHSQLEPLAAFTLQAAPHVGRYGPSLDLAPDEDFDQLVEVTGTALGTVLGQARASYRTGAPHITTGYCHTNGDSGPVASALRACRPSRAEPVFSQVALVMVTQDADRHTYQWEPPLALFDLQGAAR